jgi:hypothetical protein
MTALERTISQLAGPSSPGPAVARNALGGVFALALPIAGAVLGAKVAGKSGLIGGAVAGIVGAFVVMAKLTSKTVSEL